MSKSIEALNRIETIAPFNRNNKPNYYRQFIQSETPFYEDFYSVKRDLEILECFKKIDKKELKDFIETQIKYTLNENSWLSACNCDLEKEKPTEYLIKIKEWIKNDI